jgi:formylglycine-generating enzyme required for sulfatase activity
LYFIASACKPEPEKKRGGTDVATSTQRPARAAPVPEPPLLHETVEITGGAFFAGSVPGTPGRVPELEPRRYEVELGPFQIDRLYYPNDPSKPPRVGVSRDQARQLCAERGARLCTELEWERACKGPESASFPTGATWNSDCITNELGCKTGFNVLAMATSIREWVDSDVVPSDDGPRKHCAAKARS